MQRTTLINLLWILILTFSLNQTLAAQGNFHKEVDKTRLSLQERVVRYAYRKVYTYALAGSLDKNKYAKRFPDEVAVKNSIRFELNNFQIGPIEQIKNVRVFDLTTPPAGEIIQLTPMHSLIDDKKKRRVDRFFSLTAQWINAKYSSGMDRSMTLGEIMSYNPAGFSQFESYATYEVTVFLDGKMRTYRALALFPNTNRSTKHQRPEFIDNVVGAGGTITKVFWEDKDPKGFARVRPNGVIKDKDANETVSGQDKTGDSIVGDTVGGKAPVDSGGRSVSFSNIGYGKNAKQVCLLIDTVFGVSCNCVGAPPSPNFFADGGWMLADIANDDVFCLAQPVLPFPIGSPGGSGPGEYCEPRITRRMVKYGNRQDSQLHDYGFHYGYVALQGVCKQDEACNNSCQVETVMGPVVGEEGDDNEYFWSHQGATEVQERGASGGKDTELKCDKAVAYAFSRCLLLGCSVTAKVTFKSEYVGVEATYSGGDLWNGGITEANQCKNGQ